MTQENARELGFDTDRLARVGEAIQRDIDAERCHGVALMVARRGHVVIDLVSGFADRKSGRLLDRDAVFATMSVGKQFTNVLALSLIEKGVLRLHTPVAEVIPEFAVLGKGRVNLFHLLTHTSGVISAMPMLPPEVLTSIDKLAYYACSQPLESLPGERVNYSIGVAHAVIALMCLRADGGRRSFGQMLDDEIFRPLGMRNTSFGPRDDLLARLCPVRVAYDGVAGVIGPEAIEGIEALLRIPGGEIPAGGFLTTTQDMYRFVEMLCHGGGLDGARILSPAMIDYCARNHTGELGNHLTDASDRGWEHLPAYIGIGFFIRGERPTPGPFGALNSPRSFGGVGAGSTGFWIDPQRELSLTFMSTGLMEDSHHIERLGRLSDLIVSSIVS